MKKKEELSLEEKGLIIIAIKEKIKKIEEQRFYGYRPDVPYEFLLVAYWKIIDKMNDKLPVALRPPKS